MKRIAKNATIVVIASAAQRNASRTRWDQQQPLDEPEPATEAGLQLALELDGIFPGGRRRGGRRSRVSTAKAESEEERGAASEEQREPERGQCGPEDEVALRPDIDLGGNASGRVSVHDDADPVALLDIPLPAWSRPIAQNSWLNGASAWVLARR